jgi:hypothetical protein
MSHSPNSPDLAGWIERIRGREMPVFASTVAALRRIIGDERASASALAQVILKDTPMTTKVLRLANSAYFNHSRQAVNTVSRAIVVLGFNPVAELALSVSLIDSLLAGGCAGVSMSRWHAASMPRCRRAGRPSGAASSRPRRCSSPRSCRGSARWLSGVLAANRPRPSSAA